MIDKAVWKGRKTVIEMTPEVNRLLTQAAARSGRSKVKEASLRLADHLKSYMDIATEGRRFSADSDKLK
ncbi:TraY domain-containing protein [Sodalis endosymbiont of Spalangia cameroni]|uniref:TraY domain-containing protein n=1 Tax=Sodalis praecaptivus TaxID=1239307 RepID=UPI0031FA0479